MQTDFSGERLRLARLARCFTLDDLGQKVAATRQYLHQLENGAKVATDEMEAALADALGVTYSFFRQANLSPVQPEQCHFRKQASTPISVSSQVLARGTIIDQFLEVLDGELKLPTVDFPDIPVETALDIEKAAEICRIRWGLGLTGPITSMMRVVENAGAVVTYFDGISERVDAFSMDRPRPLIIRNEAKPAACRLRFDLAHECGHLVMHRGVQTGDKDSEAQANRFASAFLLPRTAFAREFPQGYNLNWKAIFELKARWKVSARAIIRRAYDLSLITADKYRSGNIHLNKTGQSKIEKLDDVLEAEQPELLVNALSLLERRCPEKLIKISQIVGISEQMFEVLFDRKLPIIPDFEGSNIVRLFH